MLLSTRINIPEDLRHQFKKYCRKRNITMTKLLLDGALFMIEKDVFAGEEKNSGKEIPLAPKYRYCDCGIDLFTLPPQDRLLHAQNCKNRQKE